MINTIQSSKIIFKKKSIIEEKILKLRIFSRKRQFIKFKYKMIFSLFYFFKTLVIILLIIRSNSEQHGCTKQ